MNETIMNSINDIISAKADDLFGDDFKSVAIANDDNQNEITIEDESRNAINRVSTIETPTNVTQIKSMLYKMKDQLDAIIRLVEGGEIEVIKNMNPEAKVLDSGERIIEGVFNGEKMVGADGKEYSIPPNYASKSKLVEGDMLKLTITHNGSFMFKQIGPIERKNLIGELMAIDDQFGVLVDGKIYKVLKASISFYKGKSGDEVVILVPKDGDSDWGAVDNIIKRIT